MTCLVFFADSGHQLKESLGLWHFFMAKSDDVKYSCCTVRSFAGSFCLVLPCHPSKALGFWTQLHDIMVAFMVTTCYNISLWHTMSTMPRARWCFWIGFVSVVMISSQEWSREARVSKPWVSTLPTFTMEPVKLVPTGLIWLAMAPLLVSVSTSWATRLYHLNQASAAQLGLNHIILWHVEDGLIQPLCWDASRISESGLCIKLWSNPGWKIPYIQYV